MCATISRHTTVQHELLLPIRGEVLVAVNDRVESGQVLARATQYERMRVLNVAAALGVRDEDLIGCLALGIGDPVKRGEVVGRLKRGLFSRKVKSPVEGRISAIQDGRLVIEAQPVTVEIKACLPGRVLQVISGLGAVVEYRASVIEGAWATGENAGGLIRVLATTGAENVTADRIDAAAHGCILVGGQSVEEAALKQAIQHKARGLVVGSASSEVLGRLADLPFPVMLTEGFGTIPMAEPILELVRQAEGQEACLSVRAETRDPILRPRLMISGHVGGDLSRSGRQIAEGSLVRVIREPHLGKVGRVKSIQLAPHSVESTAPQPMADVETLPGEMLVVPVRNLEPIG